MNAMTIQDQFISFIKQNGFPYINAKEAVKKNQLYFFIAESLHHAENDPAILKYIYEFIKLKNNSLKTFIIIFKTSHLATERQFENALWLRIRALHALNKVNYSYDPSLSSTPKDKNFNFSLGGTPFFVLGMHPTSSQQARRFAYPALVFNLQAQFEQRKQEHHYGAVKNEHEKSAL